MCSIASSQCRVSDELKAIPFELLMFLFSSYCLRLTLKEDKMLRLSMRNSVISCNVSFNIIFERRFSINVRFSIVSGFKNRAGLLSI